MVKPRPQAAQRRPPTVSPHTAQLTALDTRERSRGDNSGAGSGTSVARPKLDLPPWFTRTTSLLDTLATGMIPTFSTQDDQFVTKALEASQRLRVGT
jgi:hypothetical protein